MCQGQEKKVVDFVPMFLWYADISS